MPLIDVRCPASADHLIHEHGLCHIQAQRRFPLLAGFLSRAANLESDHAKRVGLQLSSALHRSNYCSSS